MKSVREFLEITCPNVEHEFIEIRVLRGEVNLMI